jgi:hypothetical protein
MNQSDLIEIARECGLPIGIRLEGVTKAVPCITVELQQFATLVAAKEREACAVQCQDIYSWRGAVMAGPMCTDTLEACASAIRGRGKEGA